MRISEYLTLAEAGRQLPGHPSPSTIWRWCTSGVAGVKLKHIRMGDRFFVHEDDIAAFGRELADTKHARRGSRNKASATNAARRTDRQRADDIQRAERACTERGI